MSGTVRRAQPNRRAIQGGDLMLAAVEFHPVAGPQHRPQRAATSGTASSRASTRATSSSPWPSSRSAATSSSRATALASHSRCPQELRPAGGTAPISDQYRIVRDRKASTAGELPDRQQQAPVVIYDSPVCDLQQLEIQPPHARSILTRVPKLPDTAQEGNRNP